MNEFNPYAASLVTDTEPAALSPEHAEYERIRRMHIGHEASIKSVGVLYGLGGVLMLLVGVFTIIGITMNGVGNAQGPVLIMAFAITAGYVLFGVFQLALARGLRRLQPWARYTAGTLLILGLVGNLITTLMVPAGVIGMAVGLLIGGYILYLLFSSKGATVFSEQYKAVIAATPHVRYKTPLIAWIALALLITLIVVLVVLASTA